VELGVYTFADVAAGSGGGGNPQSVVRAGLLGLPLA